MMVHPLTCKINFLASTAEHYFTTGITANLHNIHRRNILKSNWLFCLKKKTGHYWIKNKSKANNQYSFKVEKHVRVPSQWQHSKWENLSSQHTIGKATIWVIKLPAHQLQLLWVEETSESLVWGCSLVYRFHSFKAHVLLLIWHVSWGAGNTIQRHYKLGTCRFIWLYKISAR